MWQIWYGITNGRVDVGKIIYWLAIDVWTIRDEIERVDRLGMNKDASLTADAEVAQRAHNRAPVAARRRGKVDTPRRVHGGTWDVIAQSATATTSILWLRR